MTTWTERAHQRYLDGLAGVVHDIREMADRVERDGQPGRCFGYPEGSDHAAASHDALSAVTWGVANLDMANLMRIAVEADAAPRLEAEATDRATTTPEGP